MSGTQTSTMDFRPAGEIDMSKTCEDVSQVLLTVTEDIGPGRSVQQPDAVPGRQRRARLRRGHGPMGMGPERQPRR